jgi:curved DNA-binding protein
VVTLRVPPGTSSGKKLRVKGHGVQAKDRPPGDLFAEVLIVLPPGVDSDPDWLRLVRDLDKRYPFSPRETWQW